ncbi:unnamed protein product [Owenia fusiformis]|uniref:Uncharacterized protein n=1 Tax=Owenia fusiformis TaxID=6347 RepID=A0A8J1TTS1_OWEFU|nr:unnamed protein product [Owenia fusiformis]
MVQILFLITIWITYWISGMACGRWMNLGLVSILVYFSIISNFGVEGSLEDIPIIKKLLKRRNSTRGNDEPIQKYNSSSDCTSVTQYLVNADDPCSYYRCSRATLKFEEMECPDGRSTTSRDRKRAKKGKILETFPCAAKARTCRVKLSKEQENTILSVPKVPRCGLDIMIAVDISCSIAPLDKIKVKSFIQRMAASLPIGRAKTQLGVVSFDANVHHVLWLNSAIRSIKAVQAIHRMKLEQTNRRLQCGTATYDALNAIRNEYFTYEMGDRPTKPNAVVIITDGKTVPVDRANDTINAAKALLGDGALVFVVALPNQRSITMGLGKFIGWAEWLQMTTKKNIFTAEDFDLLESQVTNLTQSFCE